MATLNKVQIIGRVGQDVETKPAGSSCVATLSVATDESYTKDGNKVEKTEWHRVVLWGKLAELAAQYLQKGSMVYVEGKLQTREWQDKDGAKKYSTEIQGLVLQFLDSNKKSTDDSKPMQPKGMIAKAVSKSQGASDFQEDDIPF